MRLKNVVAAWASTPSLFVFLISNTSTVIMLKGGCKQTYLVC